MSFTPTALPQLSRTRRRMVAASVVAATAAGLSLTGVSGSAQAATPAGSAKEIAREIVGDDAQFQCFANIIERESNWDHTATNPSSGAYGLVQALPATKMESAGSDWKTNPATQIKWGLNYMNERYGSPCDAWKFWQDNHWY
ncbi:hypothetical protein GCM10009716_28620 [Streptomyces sodiiphilus]|uniref:Transglycosylase SLT domain-containing protein n=1 Tax=Streptomyces sodiiphilus TaxID=226217 RepID=A0ABP5AMN3_9ACTN